MIRHSSIRHGPDGTSYKPLDKEQGLEEHADYKEDRQIHRPVVTDRGFEARLATLMAW